MIHQKLISKVASRFVLGRPKKAVFSITDECSMQCKMCYNWRLKDSEKTVSAEMWKKAVRELDNLKEDEMLLNFIGGEPLEKDYVLDIVKEATKHDIKTSLTTNASMIDEKKAKEIIDSGLTTLCISLDCLDPEIHDYYRGRKGIYKKVMNALEIFSKKEKKPEIVLQAIIMDRNMNGLHKLVEFVDKNPYIIGVYFMSVMKPHHTNLPDDWYKKDKMGLWPTDMKKMSKVIDQLIKMKTKGSKIVNSVLHLQSFKNFYLYPEKFIKNKSCDVMDFGIYINSLGDVSICAEKGSIGNIKDKNLEEIWFSYESIKVKNKMKNCQKNCEFLVNCFYQDEK